MFDTASQLMQFVQLQKAVQEEAKVVALTIDLHFDMWEVALNQRLTLKAFGGFDS